MAYYKKHLGFVYGSGYKIHKRNKKTNIRLTNVQKNSEKRSAQLKKKATQEELLLKNELERRAIKFQFQKPVRDKYSFRIVDFYFPRGDKVGLVVEIDGDYHFNNKQKQKDIDRTTWIFKNLGARVIRFTNDQVISDIEKVVDKIKKELTK